MISSIFSLFTRIVIGASCGLIDVFVAFKIFDHYQYILNDYRPSLPRPYVEMTIWLIAGAFLGGFLGCLKPIELGPAIRSGSLSSLKIMGINSLLWFAFVYLTLEGEYGTQAMPVLLGIAIAFGIVTGLKVHRRQKIRG